MQSDYPWTIYDVKVFDRESKRTGRLARARRLIRGWFPWQIIDRDGIAHPIRLRNLIRAD